MLTHGYKWISKPGSQSLRALTITGMDQNYVVTATCSRSRDVESLGRLRALGSSTDMALHLGALAGYKTKTYAKAHTAKTGSALTTRGMEVAECPQRP